jgi:hypothetical protein
LGSVAPACETNRRRPTARPVGITTALGYRIFARSFCRWRAKTLSRRRARAWRTHRRCATDSGETSLSLRDLAHDHLPACSRYRGCSRSGSNWRQHDERPIRLRHAHGPPLTAVDVIDAVPAAMEKCVVRAHRLPPHRDGARDARAADCDSLTTRPCFGLSRLFQPSLSGEARALPEVSVASAMRPTLK